MQFNNTTTKQGIVQDTYFEVSANSVSYPIADVTRNSNTALDRAVTLILGADAKWDFDSTNATDLPIGSTDVLNGQKDYSFDDEYLVVKSVELADDDGNWTRLEPIDTLTIPERQALTSFASTNGTPQYYDKLGESLMLYPAPNYNRRLVEESEAGLKVYFQRNIDYFVEGDTTKTPGFATHLHKYISLYCAYVYAEAKELSKAPRLKNRLEFFEGNKLRGGNDNGAIVNFYSYRERDTEQVITSETINSI